MITNLIVGGRFRIPPMAQPILLVLSLEMVLAINSRGPFERLSAHLASSATSQAVVTSTEGPSPHSCGPATRKAP